MESGGIMLKKLIQKAYDKYKKEWHEKAATFGREIHHIFGRVSFLLCCRRFWVAGKMCHHDDYLWIKEQRELNRVAYNYAQQNFIHGQGCKEALFTECLDCMLLIKNQKGE